MITKNERALLFLISQTQHITRMKLVKLMFLISKERKIYDFVPYQYGAFSFQLYQDIRHLQREEYLSQTDDDVQFIDKKFPKPDPYIQETIIRHIKQFGEWTDRKLLEFVYQQYPEYTVFSKIKRLKDYYRNETGIVTIGYEGKNIDQFLSILVENKVGKLIDVRRNPFSMKYGYTKNQLSSALEKLGISYLHIPELGIDHSQRQNLTQKGYANLFCKYALELSEKEDILNSIKTSAKTKKVALMCFEANPSNCHRGIIAQRFRSAGLDVVDL